jgi:hypothetical protein
MRCISAIIFDLIDIVFLAFSLRFRGAMIVRKSEITQYFPELLRPLVNAVLAAKTGFSAILAGGNASAVSYGGNTG